MKPGFWEHKVDSHKIKMTTWIKRNIIKLSHDLLAPEQDLRLF